MDRVLLKTNAKKQLGGGLFQTTWLYGVLVMLIYSGILSAAGTTLIGTIILYGPLTYGLCKLFLKLVYGSETIDIAGLFDGFKDDFGGTVILGLMQSVYVFLWSLLFVIPGVIKSYAYSMAFFIKAEHPEYDWKQCLSASEAMMQGHKMELFVLELSFIGWMLVGALACGVGTLWVMPYMECTVANFYASLAAQNAQAPAEGPAEV